MPGTTSTTHVLIPNIWAVGRNYAEHAKELGNAVPEAAADPMIFLKAGSSIEFDGAEFKLPSFSKNVHFEAEVALRFGADFNFSEITIAIDLTARDLQDKLKAKGHPWTLAKSFRSACLIGPLLPIHSGLDLESLKFSLKINGALTQNGETRDMIHGIEKLRRYVLERLPVMPGDLLLTGTPSGVGQLHPGDRLEAEIPGLVKAYWSVAQLAPNFSSKA